MTSDPNDFMSTGVVIRLYQRPCKEGTWKALAVAAVSASLLSKFKIASLKVIITLKAVNFKWFDML
jgi:hypothetical protein